MRVPESRGCVFIIYFRLFLHANRCPLFFRNAKNVHVERREEIGGQCADSRQHGFVHIWFFAHKSRRISNFVVGHTVSNNGQKTTDVP